MTPFSSLDANALRRHALAMVTAAGSIVLGFTLASAIGSSSARQDRLAALQGRSDQIEQRLNALDGRPVSSVQLCGNPAAAQTALERRLGDAATRIGLTWRETRFESVTQGPVLLVGFQTTAEGPYEAIVGVLNELAQGTPTLLIGEARLAQTRQGVRLDLQGTVLCSTTSA